MKSVDLEQQETSEGANDDDTFAPTVNAKAKRKVLVILMLEHKTACCSDRISLAWC